MTAVDRDGAFLDVGCANGFLMESVRAWAAEEGYDVEPYGLEISPELAALARQRLPRWADRIFVGNAASWVPPRRFEYVRAGLDYVPPTRRRDLVEHLIADAVTPEGRLIVGVFNEEKDERRTEEQVASWGFEIAGRVDAEHRDPRVAYRVFWLDAADADSAENESKDGADG
jgi:SAM-dependent methyltransferase